MLRRGEKEKRTNLNFKKNQGNGKKKEVKTVVKLRSRGEISGNRLRGYVKESVRRGRKGFTKNRFRKEVEKFVRWARRKCGFE